MSRTRILHLIHDLDIGGAQRVILHLTEHLDLARFEPHVVSLYASTGSAVEDELRGRGIPLRFLGKRPGFDPRALVRLARFLLRLRPHVLHSHCYGLTYAYAANGLRRVPAKVHTMHTVAESEVRSRLERAIYRAAFRRGVVPVAIIEEVAESLDRVYGISGAPVIPNGIPVELFRNPPVDRETWRRANGFGREDVLFVCVARLNDPKNQAGILRTFSRLGDGQDHLHLLLVGDGPHRATLEAQAARAGMEGQVHFLGLRTDVPAILGASDVFLLFSTYEGNPLSVMEAMAAGRPVLSSAVGGIPELIGGGAAGVLVPSEDEAALAEAMLRMAGDRALRNRLGMRGAERAERLFSARAMADAYAELYDALLEEAESKS